MVDHSHGDPVSVTTLIETPQTCSLKIGSYDLGVGWGWGHEGIASQANSPNQRESCQGRRQMRRYDYLSPRSLAVSGRSVERGEENPEINREIVACSIKEQSK